MSVKPVQRAEVLGLAKGMITEVNPLAGTGDSTSNEVNFEILQDGTRSRRLGLDIEPDGQYVDTPFTWSRLQSISRSTCLWEGVAGNPELTFIVVQLGNYLYFYRSNLGASKITSLVGSLVLPYVETDPIEISNISGYLIVTGSSPNLQLVSYNVTTNTFSSEVLRLKIRDLFGVEETINSQFELDESYRGPLNPQHYYNLFNQSWALPRYDWQYGTPLYLDSVYLGSDKLPTGKSPSNSDTVWMGLDFKPIGKDSENNFESVEAFHYKQFQAITGAKNEAGKGFFIIDAFDRGNSRQVEWYRHQTKHPETGGLLGGSFETVPDITPGGPTSVAAHAGRIFYAGCRGEVVNGDKRSPNYSNYVFFTQLIKSSQDFAKCYQDGDPSSRDSNTLLDTDGGFLVISEAVNLHSMFSMGSTLFIIANNGVWSVSGGNNYGFSATNYKVDKLSNFGGVANKSLILAGDTAFFWGFEGIYTITKNQYGDYEVTNISKPVIDRFYKAIDNVAKLNVQGLFDKTLNRVRWIYTEGQPFTVESISKELILDLTHKAYYPYELKPSVADPHYMLLGIQVGDFASTYSQENVVVGGNPVVVNDVQVGAFSIALQSVPTNVKYLTVGISGGILRTRFTNYTNQNYEDWAFTDYPVDASAFMVTHSVTAGDFAIKKQVPYLVMAFRETERTLSDNIINQESSCIGSFRWDFTHASRSGMWTPGRQLYRKSRFYMGDVDIDNGFDLNITKNKLRGSGKAFALHLKTEPRKACHIYGWSLSMTGNSVA